MFAKSFIAVVAFATLALAQSATVIVEASHGGAGQGSTNTTITVPLGSPFTGNPALNAVSTLFLTGATGADVNTITCQGFKSTDGTGSGGLPFTVSTPSFLSTNTVQVGSIVCNTNSGSKSATVVVEASHGGAGQGLTNHTLTVPLGTPFTNDPSLLAVSTLFLTGATNADVNTVTCQAFKSTDGTGSGGLPFTVGSPSFLSTNTVQVGSIVCNTSGPKSATIIVEASHGGAGQGLTNSTITVPLNTPFTGNAALNAVSTLFLTGATGADVNTITCQAFKSTDGTGSGGLPFTVSSPSYLSTNTVQVGSIVCTTNSGSSGASAVTIRSSAKWRNL